MNKTVYIMRGVPGSGKSTIARKLAHGATADEVMNLTPFHGTVVSADDFFLRNGEYRYNPKEIGIAHSYCAASYALAFVHPCTIGNPQSICIPTLSGLAYFQASSFLISMFTS